MDKKLTLEEYLDLFFSRVQIVTEFFITSRVVYFVEVPRRRQSRKKKNRRWFKKFRAFGTRQLEKWKWQRRQIFQPENVNEGEAGQRIEFRQRAELRQDYEFIQWQSFTFSDAGKPTDLITPALAVSSTVVEFPKISMGSEISYESLCAWHRDSQYRKYSKTIFLGYCRRALTLHFTKNPN